MKTVDEGNWKAVSNWENQLHASYLYRCFSFISLKNTRHPLLKSHRNIGSSMRGETMDITITGRKMPVTEALRAYAEEKIGNSMKVMDIDPLTAEVVLHVEKNPANPTPATCEVTMRARGHIIRVEG